MTLTRLTNEMKVLNAERESFYQVVQDPGDMFKFYFMMRGDNESDYNKGHYIGRIELPKDYPKNPGNFFMLTPSGRFKIGSKICLTNSGYHKESWSPMWNLKNMVIAFSSIFLDDSTSGISHIRDSSANRKRMASESCDYNLKNHAEITKLFTQFITPEGKFRTYKEVDEYIANLIKEESDRKEAEKAAKKAKREAKRAKKASKKAAKKAKKEAKKAASSEQPDASNEVNEEQLEDEIDELEKELGNANNHENVSETAENVNAAAHVNVVDEAESENDNESHEDNASDNASDNAEDNNSFEVDEAEIAEGEVDEDDEEEEDEEDESKPASKPAPNSTPKPAPKRTVKTQAQDEPKIRVKRKQRVYPRNREEWLNAVDSMTLNTHDPRILAMNF